MKKLLSILLAIVLLCGCTGCRTAVPNTSLTGIYQNDQITVKYIAVTDRVWPEGISETWYYNNYAIIYDAGTAEKPYTDYQNRYSCMDASGKILFTKTCDEMLPINKNGTTYINITSATAEAYYAKVDLMGNETPCTREEYDQAKKQINDAVHQYLPWENTTLYGHFEETVQQDGTTYRTAVRNNGTQCGTFEQPASELQWWAPNLIVVGKAGESKTLYDAFGKQLSVEPLDNIGNFYNGIAPFWKDGKLGLLGDDGTVIIPATLETTNATHNYSIALEDKIVIEHAGKIAVLEIQRSPKK